MSHKLPKWAIEALREAGVSEEAIAGAGDDHEEMGAGPAAKTGPQPAKLGGDRITPEGTRPFGVADGTDTPAGIVFGEYLWPKDLAPFLFNAINGSFDPLPEDLWKKYKDSAAFNKRDYNPWAALLAFSTQYFEVDLPAIEAELAAAAGVDGAGGADGASGAPADKDAPFETIGTILGMGGRAARELAHQDPASFINLLVEEASGDGTTSGILRNFLISQAPRLYSLAGLDELLGRDVERTSAITGKVDGKAGPGSRLTVTDTPLDSMALVERAFSEFVTPGKGGSFRGSKANVVQSLTELAGQSDKIPGSAASDPRDFFDDAFFMVQNVLAPTMTSTAAGTLFNNERRVLERALYTTAIAQGEFKGNPLEWLQGRGFF